ncbi:hypothetical protein NQ317_012509 [Molorchus minor]|uniref:Uncharacterized protein n=1 Tax=Molorchus minor TaxID=1323400 RepID=A0ABQ9K1F9_9CUCU|nr:hypothetical protein NQ317_012509 [Molorchus minor]
MSQTTNLSRLDRLHQSLPALDILACPEIRSRPQLKSKWRRRGDEAMTYTVSAFYAKTLVILGIAFPVTDAIATDEYDTFDAFYMYLYVGSIAFLIYMYVTQLKEKSMKENRGYSVTGSSAMPEDRHNKITYIRYGSFYFKMGVTELKSPQNNQTTQFLITPYKGSELVPVIYSAFQFGEYWELSAEKDCNNLSRAIKPLLRIIFALMQMLFIFSYSNDGMFLVAHKSKTIANFGLMHMIATNLCEWFFVLVQETQGDIYRSAQRRQNNAARDNSTLSLLDFQFINSNKGARDLSTETSRQSGSNPIYSRSQSQFSVDCAQAHKGLFAGILVLAVTIISLIMFFELVGQKDLKDATILQVRRKTSKCVGSSIVLGGNHRRGLLHSSLKRCQLVRTKTKVRTGTPPAAGDTVWRFHVLFVSNHRRDPHGTDKGKGGIMRIVTPLSALVQSSCQTVLVLDAWQRRCSTESQMRRKPGRQLITFLLLANISLWVVNRLKNNRSVSHPNQMDFYGILAWNIITHVSMPLVVSYRFQSTVCFYEIWKHVYKTKNVKRIFKMIAVSKR